MIRELEGRRSQISFGGGKSGLHRAGRWVTPRRSDPRIVPQKTDRLTPIRVLGKGETVG